MSVVDRFSLVAGLVVAGAVACSSPAPICGAAGEACCAGACDGTLVCSSGTCVRVHEMADAGPCGELAQPCCTGLHCSAPLACAAGLCIDPLGQPCAKNSECLSLLCLPVGGGPTGDVCTLECDGDAGSCRPGWNCAPLAGVPAPVCQCHYATETCNGLDDDCDGVIDGPPAAAWCASVDAGSACAQSTCAP